MKYLFDNPKDWEIQEKIIEIIDWINKQEKLKPSKIIEIDEYIKKQLEKLLILQSATENNLETWHYFQGKTYAYEDILTQLKQ